MTTSPITGVLFDWGHTLFETAGSIDFIVAWTAERGRPLSLDDAERLHGDALRRSRHPDELAKGRDLSAARHRECWLALWTELEQAAPGVSAPLYAVETSATGWTPYPDTREVLEQLAALDVPVAIVSDVPFDLRPIFAHYELSDLVDAYVLSVEHGSLKADGKLFAIALEAIDRAPQDVLMVGDNPANDGAAVACGIRTLLLPHPPPGSRRGLGAVLQLIGRSPDSAGASDPSR